MKQANIKTWKDGYIDEYPQFGKIADDQIKIFWPWNEINVEKDKQDLLTEMSEAEAHGTTFNLKLFTKYELYVGIEHWAGRIMKTYPHVGPQRMAAAFAHVELNSHAPFYARINEELGLADMKFYTSYLDDPVLAARMKFIDDMIANSDDELSAAVFSITEGAVLYTAFAYLKHFQSQGKNKIANICRGLNMSARDENLHAIGGAGLVVKALQEQQRTDYEMLQFRQAVQEAGRQLAEHEFLIADKTFEKGKHEGITAHQLKQFGKKRVNLCLANVGVEPIFTAEEVKYDPISDWFYDGINNYQMNDFFQGVGREYERGWDVSRFKWVKG